MKEKCKRLRLCINVVLFHFGLCLKIAMLEKALIIKIIKYFIQLYLFVEVDFFMLCLVPGKYKRKKKNAKANDFLMFGCPIKYSKENEI